MVHENMKRFGVIDGKKCQLDLKQRMFGKHIRQKLGLDKKVSQKDRVNHFIANSMMEGHAKEMVKQFAEKADENEKKRRDQLEVRMLNHTQKTAVQSPKKVAANNYLTQQHSPTKRPVTALP